MSAAPAEDDLRCIRCANGRLSSVANGADLTCAACGAAYPEILGVPFIAAYEQEEIVSLIEVTANIVNRGNFGVTPAVVEEWEGMLAGYHAAEDKAAFVRETESARTPYLLNRYGEWVELQVLTEDLALDGRRVLDLGAGLGFDSHRLALKGADVTALEFSPVLSEWGAENFPHMRWIGGLAHVLPFQSNSFDAVFCNAALHHFSDISAAITEGLRVLREGGVLITTCDSFRADHQDELAEARIFAREPAVLMGVNERVPRFSEFMRALLQHREHIDVTIYTHTLYNAPSPSGEEVTLTDLTAWDFDKDLAMLSARSGSLALKVTLKRALETPARSLSNPVLQPQEFAAVLTDSAAAAARLAPLAPAGYINLPFPGAPGAISKFELLNGWLLPEHRVSSRSAYKRGRWFLRRKPSEHYLLFDVRTPRGEKQGDVTIEVRVNGAVALSEPAVRGAWKRFSVDLSATEPDTTFALEVRAETGSDSLEGGCFDVRDRQFAATAGGSILGRARAAFADIVRQTERVQP